MLEGRERSTRLRDQPREPRVCALGPSTHPSVQRHRGYRKPPTEIQFVEVTGSDGDKQQLVWTLLFNEAEWHLSRQQGPVIARQQRAGARTIMLHAPELSIHRAKDPTSAALPESCVQAFARSDFHQPAASCELLGAQRPKGCQWLPFTVTDVRSLRSPVAQHECFRIRGAEAAKARNGGAFPVVVLLEQALHQLGEHLLLAVGQGLPNQWLQRSYVCFPHLRLTSHAGLCWSVLDIVEVAPPLVVKISEFCFGNGAPRGWWQKETVQFLGCHCGVQPSSMFRGLGIICLGIALVGAAAVARLRDDGDSDLPWPYQRLYFWTKRSASWSNISCCPWVSACAAGGCCPSTSASSASEQ
ncbi:hypothetical protein HPB52_001104 [Rhipicephalus sanguineus]|uniref:Uncharacterized protein n=1 Tax=Rhipicephalus sanguineus TaxID=34632 RepID=A0A9D4QG93_RHISA|nr:hypothetical protein HPB52_001104 [Rhipicephalus sanguineus]